MKVMETFECMLTRRSIRKFKDVEVEWYLIGKVLNAGFLAPSAGNLQDFRFMVVTDPNLKKGVAQAALDQLWIEKAPVIIVIFSEFTKAKRFYGIRGERLYTIQDCAAAAQNILLEANDLGLAACWVGAFDEDRLCSVLGIPDYARPQAIIPLGYSDEQPPVPAKFKLTDLVFINRWGDNGGKVLDISAEVIKDWAPHVQKVIDGTIKAVSGAGTKFGDAITNGAKNLTGKLKSRKKNK